MDITIDIGEVKLNYRTCLMIIKDNKILVESSPEAENSAFPGGRVKIGEDTKTCIIREMQEEMNYTFKKEDLIESAFLENFFTYKNQPVHELMFVYKVYVDNTFNIKDNDKNLDSYENYYRWVNKNDFDSANILPIVLKKIN